MSTPDDQHPEASAPTPSGSTGLAYDPSGGARSPSASGYLLDALRRRPLGRRVLSLLTGLLFVGGMALFAYPFFTDVYTEQVLQSRLEDQFQTIQVESVEEWQAQVDANSGSALTRIAIPAIDIETLVVEGTSAAALRAGAGHYPNTPLPGQSGNVAIAGHRTTYGKPFNRVDELTVGESIWLSTPIGDFEYVIADPPTDGACQRASADRAACVTNPRDWSIINQTPDSVLTLTSCHPKGSAAQRIVIRATLAERHPAGTYEQMRDGGDFQALAR